MESGTFEWCEILRGRCGLAPPETKEAQTDGLTVSVTAVSQGAKEESMSVIRILAVLAIAATFGLAGGCGGDDDDDDETTQAASAEQVTVTTSDTADGYTWNVSPTPTAETTSVTLQNESQEDHALIFARLGKGYTVEEAYELEGRKGSATEVIQTAGARPGKSATTKVIKPLDPGEYVLLCPVVGKAGPHYKLGQLAQFAIE
jgi:hypothetical protein